MQAGLFGANLRVAQRYEDMGPTCASLTGGVSNSWAGTVPAQPKRHAQTWRLIRSA